MKNAAKPAEGESTPQYKTQTFYGLMKIKENAQSVRLELQRRTLHV
jgi:hypothetical protein